MPFDDVTQYRLGNFVTGHRESSQILVVTSPKVEHMSQKFTTAQVG